MRLDGQYSRILRYKPLLIALTARTCAVSWDTSCRLGCPGSTGWTQSLRGAGKLVFATGFQVLSRISLVYTHRILEKP